MSNKQGVDWRSIPGAGGLEDLHIFEDPDHSDLICVAGYARRGYVLQADDESYRWQRFREPVWEGRHETDETFFGRYTYTSAMGHEHRATLANYFTDEFGSRTSLCPFRVATDRESCRFKQGDPVLVQVEITVLSEDLSIKLPVQEKEQICWHLRVVNPEGVRETASPLNYAKLFPQGRNREIEQDVRRRYREEHPLRVHQLSKGNPFRRTVCLSDIYDFSRSGTYKAQLRYGTGFLADKDKGEWSGSFAGFVFTIEIVEDERARKRSTVENVNLSASIRRRTPPKWCVHKITLNEEHEP